MSHSLEGILILVAAMTVESFAQLFLKIGAAKKSGMGWVVLGTAAYGLEIALYSGALRTLDLSVAFPLGSLCFVGVALLSRSFLGEAVSPVRWLGIACILAGTIVVTV